MSWIQFEDCETVYNASSGGYWQAFGNGLLFVGLVLTFARMAQDALPGTGQASLDLPTAFILLVLALSIGLTAYFAVAGAMRQYNSKVGLGKDGVLVQDWRGRRRFIQWRHITGLTQTTRTCKSQDTIVLSLDVRNDLGETKAVQVAYYYPVTVSWFTLGRRSGELRDPIIERCGLIEGETDKRTRWVCVVAVGRYHSVERRVWHK